MSTRTRYLQRSRQAVTPGSRRIRTQLRTKSASFGLLQPIRAAAAVMSAVTRTGANAKPDARRSTR
ncbi:hypothetical protein [Cryobacterium roopkundense]|uniref:Uncharacterized protein n=1 Tax=Cryobacterium roopkundense TaxID=1001240 RepID=A0A7W9E4R9_9MICO|nr:hypothetical protein [Cryobacterium roopkundense]MBB5642518.1 hypothetical protein [Cryobacterium roopkundense]